MIIFIKLVYLSSVISLNCHLSEITKLELLNLAFASVLLLHLI